MVFELCEVFGLIKWQAQEIRLRLGFIARVALTRTQAAPADHVRRDGPQLPLGFNVLQQSLVKAPRTRRVGFQLTSRDLTATGDGRREQARSFWQQ